MKLLPKILTIISFLVIIGCHHQTSSILKIGAIAGPETTIIETAQTIMKNQYHYQTKLITFGDYQLPNQATTDQEIDVNIFQHLPFFEFYKQHNPKAELYVVGKTFIYPMGIYSKTLKNISQLKTQAKIAIPNDPTNETRALKLLAKAKLIVLKKRRRHSLLTTDDISINPKQLNIITADAANLPRLLEDVSLAAINTNYALPANLIPARDALFLETKNSDYANIVVSRFKADSPKIKALMQALHDPKVIQVAKKLFKGAAIPAWTTTSSVQAKQ